jgi:hypothetical protein
VNARDYYGELQSAILARPYVLSLEAQFEEIDTNECYIRGVLTLIDGFELHIAEYVVTEPVVTRSKYRYHLQTSAGQQVSRWDNAPHHPQVSTFPHHRHDDQGRVHPSSPVTVADVLEVALEHIIPTPPD